VTTTTTITKSAKMDAEMDGDLAIPFYHTFTGICSGPTGCGKSELMKNIILNVNKMVHPIPQRIIWYYAEKQPKLEQALVPAGVEFRLGLPEMSDFDGEQSTLIVIDDMMSECNKEITKLFTKGSHHRNLSIWFLMQNFFHRGNEIRTITRQAQYIILFKNPRDIQQAGYLARQMFGRDANYMEDAYEKATSEPYGYLVIDVKPETPPEIRLRSEILPQDPVVCHPCGRTYKKDWFEYFAP
jgi:Adenovirus IVa2 protein